MTVILINNITKNDRNTVGGKALGCAVMKHMGMSVPEGFAVTRHAFDAFLEHRKLTGLVQDTIAAFSGKDTEDDLERKCRALADTIRNAALHDTLKKTLHAHILRLSGPVAVRSSATIEDSMECAFAGVFHSELNVEKDALEHAVLTCWSQFFEYHALTQIMRSNTDPRDMGVALLVQEMVPAEKAGVLFTMDPTGRDTHLAILSVTEGTGEKLMDGQTSEEPIKVVRKSRLPKDYTQKPPVSQAVLTELMNHGRMLENEFNHPQDIEWAIAGNHIFFLQVRPITTISDRAMRSIEWTRELSEERYPKPISPLGWSILQDLFQENLKVLSKRFGLTAKHPEHVAITIRHHVYSNRHFFDIPRSMRPNPLKQKKLLVHLIKEQADVLRYVIPSMATTSSFGFKWLILSRFFKAFIFPHAGEILEAWDKHLHGSIKEMDEFNTIDFESLDVKELLAVRERMEASAMQYMEPDLAIYVVKMACSWMVEKIAQTVQPEDPVSMLTDLTSALDNNRTLTMNKDIARMSELFKAEPDIKRFLLDEDYDAVIRTMAEKNKPLLDAFIEHNGHLTTNWDIMESTWGEDPVKILQMLRSYIVSDALKTFQDFQAQGKKRFKEARDTIMRHFDDSSWMVSFFDDVVVYLREFMRIDEEHHFYCSRLFKPMRKLFFELGRRFAEQHVINQAEDIFFLTLPEIYDAADTSGTFPRRYLVQSRQTSFRQSLANRPPDNFIGLSPVIPKADPVIRNGNAAWKGNGAGPGVAMGRVRIIESTADARDFAEGDVFVTTSPNPAFTPLFAVASALVTSTGSILSHGVVSAREYQLPAVIGIPDITRKLENGQYIKVDGDNGIVSLIQYND